MMCVEVRHVKTGKWQAFCTVCLGGGKFLTPPVAKKVAEKEATSHVTQFRHEVVVLEAKREGTP
jgi:hypothetical protein